MSNKRRILNWALLISWMSIIAIMSQKSAELSDAQSMGLIYRMQTFGVDMVSIFGSYTNFLVRKLAHLFEYMILGILFFNVFSMYFKRKKIIILTISLVIFYAITDEYHQTFIVGRQGTIRDVFIDGCGGVLAVIIRNYLGNMKKSNN